MFLYCLLTVLILLLIFSVLSPLFLNDILEDLPSFVIVFFTSFCFLTQALIVSILPNHPS